MKHVIFPDGRVSFLCDRCGIHLDEADDPGTPYWEDYNRFLKTVGTPAADEEPTLLLCRKCLEMTTTDVNYYSGH